MADPGPSHLLAIHLDDLLAARQHPGGDPLRPFIGAHRMGRRPRA